MQIALFAEALRVVWPVQVLTLPHLLSMVTFSFLKWLLASFIKFLGFWRTRNGLWYFNFLSWFDYCFFYTKPILLTSSSFFQVNRCLFDCNLLLRQPRHFGSRLGRRGASLRWFLHDLIACLLKWHRHILAIDWNCVNIFICMELTIMCSSLIQRPLISRAFTNIL